jgi:hypothetical protein
VNERSPLEEESAAARRARVLVRMTEARSAFWTENHGERYVASPSSSQSAVITPPAPSSPLNSLLTSPNAEIVAALLVGSAILGPRRVIIAAAVPFLRAVIDWAVQNRSLH